MPGLPKNIIDLYEAKTLLLKELERKRVRCSVFDGLKFRKVSSPIHNLDPRMKFIYVIAVFVAAILFSSIIPLLVLFFMQIPFVLLGTSAKAVASFASRRSFPGTIHIPRQHSGNFFTQGYTVTAANLENAAAMTLRFVVLVESFSVFFLTTSPDHLGLALEQSRVPYEFSFAFTTAVRFVPVLAEEAQTIMDAQKARGLELEKGNFMKRIRNYVPVLIPLIVSAIRRSLELAEAMEITCMGRHQETHKPVRT